MTAKELFHAACDAERRIKAIRLRQAHYREMATSMSVAIGDGIHTKDKKSRVEICVEGLDVLARELEDIADDYLSLAREAENLIRRVPTARHAEILSRRYVDHQHWEFIAREMGLIGEGYVYQVHREAVKEAQKVMNASETAPGAAAAVNRINGKGAEENA